MVNITYKTPCCSRHSYKLQEAVLSVSVLEPLFYTLVGTGPENYPKIWCHFLSGGKSCDHWKKPRGEIGGI